MTLRVTEAEILPPGMEPADTMKPRFGGAGGIFSNENLDLLSRVLDTWFQIPGTSIRFGIDGIIGFIPGVGDLLAGLAAFRLQSNRRSFHVLARLCTLQRDDS